MSNCLSRTPPVMLFGATELVSLQRQPQPLPSALADVDLGDAP